MQEALGVYLLELLHHLLNLGFNAVYSSQLSLPELRAVPLNLLNLLVHRLLEREAMESLDVLLASDQSVGAVERPTLLHVVALVELLLGLLVLCSHCKKSTTEGITAVEVTYAVDFLRGNRLRGVAELSEEAQHRLMLLLATETTPRRAEGDGSRAGCGEVGARAVHSGDGVNTEYVNRAPAP